MNARFAYFGQEFSPAFRQHEREKEKERAVREKTRMIKVCYIYWRTGLMD
jgi:hypothetical protein